MDSSALESLIGLDDYIDAIGDRVSEDDDEIFSGLVVDEDVVQGWNDKIRGESVDRLLATSGSFDEINAALNLSHWLRTVLPGLIGGYAGKVHYHNGRTLLWDSEGGSSADIHVKSEARRLSDIHDVDVLCIDLPDGDVAVVFRDSGRRDDEEYGVQGIIRMFYSLDRKLDDILETYEKTDNERRLKRLAKRYFSLAKRKKKKEPNWEIPEEAIDMMDEWEIDYSALDPELAEEATTRKAKATDEYASMVAQLKKLGVTPAELAEMAAEGDGDDKEPGEKVSGLDDDIYAGVAEALEGHVFDSDAPDSYGLLHPLPSATGSAAATQQHAKLAQAYATAGQPGRSANEMGLAWQSGFWLRGQPGQVSEEGYRAMGAGLQGRQLPVVSAYDADWTTAGSIDLEAIGDEVADLL